MLDQIEKNEEKLRVVIFSFGFKYGTPVQANFVMDVRFLPNPYWVDELREKTGFEEDVAGYVLKSSAGKKAVSGLEVFLQMLVEQNIEAKKTILRIAVGCTGGRHRSVAVTRWVEEFLREFDLDLLVFHRDIEKDKLLKA